MKKIAIPMYVGCVCVCACVRVCVCACMHACACVHVHVAMSSMSMDDNLGRGNSTHCIPKSNYFYVMSNHEVIRIEFVRVKENVWKYDSFVQSLITCMYVPYTMHRVLSLQYLPKQRVRGIRCGLGGACSLWLCPIPV